MQASFWPPNNNDNDDGIDVDALSMLQAVDRQKAVEAAARNRQLCDCRVYMLVAADPAAYLGVQVQNFLRRAALRCQLDKADARSAAREERASMTSGKENRCREICRQVHCLVNNETDARQTRKK